MMHNPPLKARDEKAGSSRWHALKANFRYLFAEDCVQVVEDWYNLVAPQRHREAFREVAKGINQSEPAPDAPPESASLEGHRAAHMMQLYGQVLSPGGRARARTWLLTAEAQLIDKFRDVFTAISKALAVRTTTKEAFVQRPVCDPPPKDRNRRKIDWNSQAVGNKIRQTTMDPMAGDRLPMIGAPRLSSAKQEADAEPSPDLDSQCNDTFNKLHDRQRQNTLEGVYTMTADGCTVYQPKPRVGLDNTRERIITGLGNQTSSWKSTTREHIRNHGHVTREMISAEKHPAIARMTASTGLIVPTLKAKNLGPHNSSSSPAH
jgi:hypothetical protein